MPANRRTQEATEEEWAAWREMFPIDVQGIPQTRIAYTLVDFFFRNRNRDISFEELANVTYEKPELLRIMCNQYVDAGVLKKTGGWDYRYDTSSDSRYQINVESFLAESSFEIERAMQGSWRTPSSKE